MITFFLTTVEKLIVHDGSNTDKHTNIFCN